MTNVEPGEDPADTARREAHEELGIDADLSLAGARPVMVTMTLTREQEHRSRAYDAVVTIRLASDRPRTLQAPTIGAAWLAVARRILSAGVASRYDDRAVREISLVTLAVDRPDPADEIIARHAEAERLAWMHANFTDYTQVAALGGADSYARRLFDYEHSGRDQVAWVIDRLRQDPATRSAAITTFQPHSDTSYIPCVSLLDFWLPDGAVELVTYAHSIDFGAKGYGNLVELAALQQHVAGQLGRPAGRLLVVVKSAHVYETERDYVLGVLTAEDGPAATGALAAAEDALAAGDEVR